MDNPKKRLVSTTNEEIEKLRDNRHEVETKKSTVWGVKLFKGKLVIKIKVNIKNGSSSSLIYSVN